jgi:hypothetical protein
MESLTDVYAMIERYQRLARLRDRAHFKMAQRLIRRERMLGIPVIVLSTIVGTAIFASLETQAEVGWKILGGILSVSAAVFAALQTFFNYGSAADQHAAASAGYSQLGRRIDYFKLLHFSGDTTREKALTDLGDLIRAIDELDQKFPRTTSRIWREVVETRKRELEAAQGEKTGS